MENGEPDEYTEEEKTLLESLKMNCSKDNGKEIDPKISATIFHKMGMLYLERIRTIENCSTIAKMIWFIRCAVLLNAALLRTHKYANLIKQDLNQLHLHLLQSAKAKQQDVDLSKMTEIVKLSVEKMRKQVHQKLHEIRKIDAYESEEKMQEQEQNKVKAIQSLQNKIADDYTEIMASVAKFCEQIMGAVPCKFAILGMGSLARKEITPYSDFEHIIVLDSNFDGQNEKTLDYFRWYSIIFQIILINLGETIIPSVINRTNSKVWEMVYDENSRFYDDITKSGISFDGNFPWACKFPLGRQQLTKDKPWNTELIKSVPDMLQYLSCEESLKNGYHLGDILTKVCYVYGQESLYEQFKSGMQDTLMIHDETLHTEVLGQIKDDLKNFSIRSVVLEIGNSGKYNVKKDVYRVTTLFIAALGRLYKISALSCFDIIRELAEKRKISKYAKHNLMYAIAIACEIRLRWYMVNKRQKDDINDNDAKSKFLGIVGKTSAIRYFQIAYALQCDISNRFNFKKLHYYTHPAMLNISIYSGFQISGVLEQNFLLNLSQKSDLDNFDDCLRQLTIKKISIFDQLAINIFTNKRKVLCDSIEQIGLELQSLNKLIDAKEYLERALKYKQRASSDVATDRNVAFTLQHLGRCLIQMNEFTTAKDYLEEALKIYHRTSSDIVTDRNVADVLYLMATCLTEASELTAAKECLNKVLKVYEQSSNDIATDRNMAKILCEVAQCFTKIDELTTAKEYWEKALKIYEETSSDVATDSNVAKTLHGIGRCLLEMNELNAAREYLEKARNIEKKRVNILSINKGLLSILHDIGRCLIKMNKLATAKEYLEKVLKINEIRSNDVATDRNVAGILIDIGHCLIKMNEFTPAYEHLEKALKIYEQSSSNVDTDRNMAKSLCEIAQCFIQMNELTAAKEYLEKALRIYERTSSNLATDRNVAFTLHSIGQCLIEMNELASAKEYLEKALKIEEQTSSEVATDKHVASTLHEIGRCLIKMNELITAKDYLEKSLKIYEQILNDVATNRYVARTLIDIGRFLILMNEFTTVKKYFKKALKIYEQTSSDVAADRNVANALYVTGRCLIEMNELTEAKEYLEKALKIYERTSSDITTDRNVAKTLREIGLYFIKINEPFGANEYLEKALKIYERTSSNVLSDRNVDIILHSIGRCLSKVSEFTNATIF